MSSSSSAAARPFLVVSPDGGAEPRKVGNPTLTRARGLRGFSFDRGVSPLDAELPGPPVEVEPARAAAEERRGYEAGFAEGLAAGRAAAAGETAAALARLESLGRSLAEA